MLSRTAIVVGPGGIGKSPLDYLFNVDVRIDPYRLRSEKHPRNENDIFYIHPKFNDELRLLFETVGVESRRIDKNYDKPIEWFGKIKILLFEVRGDFQILFMLGLNGNAAKAEIYAPLLPDILGDIEVSEFFGIHDIIILNPSSQSINEMIDLNDLEERIEHNCFKRGDPEESVRKRVKSITEEIQSWKILIDNDSYNATEYLDWQYPEYLYMKPPQGNDKISLLEHQKNLLKKARRCLLDKNPKLEIYFKTENQIDKITEPFV